MCLEIYVDLSKRQEESPLLESSTATSSTDNKRHKPFSQVSLSSTGHFKSSSPFSTRLYPTYLFWKPYIWSNYFILKGHSGDCAESANADY